MARVVKDLTVLSAHPRVYPRYIPANFCFSERFVVIQCWTKYLSKLPAWIRGNAKTVLYQEGTKEDEGDEVWNG